MSKTIVLIIFTMLFMYIANLYNIRNNNRLADMHQTTNAAVKIYTKASCSYCIKAKQFLKDRNIAFEEVDISLNPSLHNELNEKTGAKTVPYIYINKVFIGGYSDMIKMSENGNLEKLLLFSN